MKKSTGFQSHSNGFSRTQIIQVPNSLSPFAQTIKTDRKVLLQNFLQQNVEKHPFNQRVFNKTMTLDAEIKKEEKNIPGVMQQQQLKYNDLTPQWKVKRQQRIPAVVIQSWMRMCLAKKRMKEKRNYFKKLMSENSKITIVDKLVKEEKEQANQIIKTIQKSRARKEQEGDPFFTCLVEIMGERAFDYEDGDYRPTPIVATKQMKLKPKSKEQCQVKLINVKPKLNDDGASIWKAFYKKKYNKEINSIDEAKLKINTDYVDKQYKVEQSQQLSEQKRKKKLNDLLDKEMPEKPKLKIEKKKVVYQDIDEDIDQDIEDEIGEDSQIQDEIDDDVEEEIIQGDSQIKEESIQESSQIKESMRESIQKSSRLKESIVEEYEDDFEEASQGISYENDEFESYHSQTKNTLIKDRTEEYVSKVISKPIEIDETQGWTSKRGRQEAEILLKNYSVKYQELRQIKVDDDDLEELRQEHKDLKLIQNQVNNLINHTGDFYKNWNQNQNHQQSGQSAEHLYAKFQYEFQRLLSMNTLGARFNKILNTTLPKDLPNSNINNLTLSIERQFQVVQQVLETVLLQVSNLFDNTQLLQELKNHRQEMDQKLQWLLFKQDKIVNNQLEKQLLQRDKDLKQFILEQFEKQRKELGVKKISATVDANSLKDALIKNQGLIQSSSYYKFEQSAQSKKDSSMMTQNKKSIREESYYQPDFDEEISERVKTEKSDRQSYESNYQNSLSADKEVFEVSQQSEIDWQNDIDLFDQNKSAFFTQKDQEAQILVDYLTDMLLKEIKQDLFPNRNTDNLFQEQQQEKEEQNNSTQLEQINPILPSSKPKAEPQDDFGMGFPVISREELSKEFDLSGPVISDEPSQSVKDNEEEQVPIQLVVDAKYQAFVQQILDKYGRILTNKQKIIETQFEQIIQKKYKKETLGSAFSSQFHFILQSDVYEQNAFQIVQTLEEQICSIMLLQWTQQIKHNFPLILESAKKIVLDITKSRIPIDSLQLESKFQTVLKHATKKIPLKECPISDGLENAYLEQELKELGQQACNHIIKSIISETMEDFDAINRKKNTARK